MNWQIYYSLLKKYQGNIAHATPLELRSAVLANPSSPTKAFKIALEKYFNPAYLNKIYN